MLHMICQKLDCARLGQFQRVFGTQCEIATPERKTITQRVLLLQVRVHALAAMPIRIQ
jgi:hypothetical protein